MPRMPDDMAARYGEILDQFEASIETLNSSKSDTLNDLRADLKQLGMTGAEISAEVAMLKGAVKLQRMTEAERLKADAKDDGVADYVNVLTLARTRAHVENIEEFGPKRENPVKSELPEHDADGVIIETAGELVAPGMEAADHGTDDAGGQAADLSAGGEDVAISPAHAPEQPGNDHGSVSTPDAGGAKASAIRRMSMTPLEPREAGALKGFGFESSASSQISGAVVLSGGADPAASSAGMEGEVDRRPHPEPVPAADLPAVTVADARSAGTPPAAAPGVSNITPFRTHNPETHFLNSKGLLRLHGCLKAEVCGSEQPRSKLCFSCSVSHDGPTYQGGDAA